MSIKSILFTAVLVFLFHAAVFAQEEELTKIYDVSFLRTFIPNEDYSEPVTSICEEYTFGDAGNHFIACMSGLVSIHSRTDFLSPDKMKVSGSEEDHIIVQKYLDNIKAFMSRKILITAWLVKVDGAVLADIKAKSRMKTPSNILPREQVDLLVKKSSTASVFEFNLRHMQKGRSESAKEVSYTQDYNIEIAAGSAALRPEMSTTGDLAGLTITPFINMAGDAIRMDIVLRRTMLESRMEQFENAALIKKFFDGTSGPEEPDIEVGKLELPTVDSLRLSTSIIVPAGAYVIAGEFNSNERDGREKWVLLMNAGIHDRGSQTYGILPLLEANGSKDTKLYDVAAIFQPFPYYKKRYESKSDDFERVSFLDNYYEHTCLSDTMEIKFEYFPAFSLEIYDNIFFEHACSGFVCYSADDEEQQSGFKRELSAAQDDILRAITVDASFCRIPGEAYKDDVLALEQSRRADAILKMIVKNPEFIMATGSITGLNGQVFGGDRTLRRDYVKDHNVELASGIIAYDPVIGNIYRGIDMQVCPLITDKRKISLILNAAYSDFNNDLAVFEICDGNLRRQQPEITEYAFETSLVLDDNIYEYLVYPAQDDEGSYIVLLLKAVIVR